MSIYQSKTIPFTYLIGWTTHNKWYYGVRYANNCQPADLWNSYFTSSTIVKDFRKNHGEPDIILIRKTFKSKQDAIIWEGKILSRLWKFRDFWLNKRFSATKFIPTKESIQKCIDRKNNRSLIEHQQVILNISIGAKCGHANMTEETKKIRSKKISDANKNRSKEIIQKISNSVRNIAKNRSDIENQIIEEKRRITREKNKLLGKKRKIPVDISYRCCIYCKRQFDPGNFSKHIKTCQ